MSERKTFVPSPEQPCFCDCHRQRRDDLLLRDHVECSRCARGLHLTKPKGRHGRP